MYTCVHMYVYIYIYIHIMYMYVHTRICISNHLYKQPKRPIIKSFLASEIPYNM